MLEKIKTEDLAFSVVIKKEDHEKNHDNLSLDLKLPK